MQKPDDDLHHPNESKAETYFERKPTDGAISAQECKAMLDVGCSDGAFGEWLKSLDS